MDRILMEDAAIRSFVAGRGGSQEEQDRLARDLFDAMDATRRAEALADAQTAAEEASRKNAEAMTPTDAEQEAADAIRDADQDETFVSDWNKATSVARKGEQESARKADILALHRASAAQQIHNAEIVAAGLDKPGQKKCEADLVQDARKLHDKIGRTLDPVIGKPLQFHRAYAAFALALLDLLEDVRQERPI